MKRRIPFLIAVSLLVTLQTSAQSTTSRPEVEVAAIHLSAPGGGDLGNIHIAPGRFEAHNMSVRKLIYIAYKVKADSILGGPGWLNSDHYDITATAEDMTGNNFPLMLQTLLEDRFKLKLHPETKEGSVYELTITKSGAKLQPTKPGTCLQLDLSKTRPTPPANNKWCSWQDTRPGYRDGKGIGISEAAGVGFQSLSGQLSLILDKPVLDKTGLAGRFDIHLEWTPDELSTNPADSGQPTPPSGIAPSIFTAMREQLGLELKPTKGPVPFLIIDSIERPSEN